jgi:cobalt-zinc-cadmium efflux system membrane fusion protein
MQVDKNVSWVATFILLSALTNNQAWAHGDEDHGDESKAVVTAAPILQKSVHGQIVMNEPSIRLSDGSVFMPKSVQRQLGLRTKLAQKGEFPLVIELNGRVVADPNAGGRVQTFQSGRIEAGPNGLAVLGQRVSKGQVLAYLQPASSSIERATQQSTLAELASQESVLEHRYARLQQLEGSVPQKDIEQAGIELNSFKKRRGAIGSSLSRESLIAPVSGVVSASNVAVGQVVDAREVVFEVVDPKRLSVEAMAFDPLLINGLGKATALLTNGTLNLSFIGVGLTLKEQAMPVLFKVEVAKDGTLPAVAVGQTVKVLAQTKATKKGVAIPAVSVVRNTANETVVWVHETAEHFESRRVKTEPLDGDSVLVTNGLSGDERIVVQGASSLSQVR